VQSDYFLQTLLRDYMKTHDCRHWDVVWDARGHFTEPHNMRVIPIGTLEVRQYLGDRPKFGRAVETKIRRLYPTLGPEDRFKTVLFIEKEGFDPLLDAAQIANRFDVAIMSTKGMSVSASRQLVDRLVSRGVTKVLVLHDFDISGFSIFGTLGTSSDVYRYTNKVPIIDLGLRLSDVRAMDLLAEPVVVMEDDAWAARAATLKRHGATANEITFLAEKRVELNAMTSAEFVAFIEAKFSEHGVSKVVPGDEVMRRHARRVVEQRLAEKELEKIRERIAKKAALIPLPEDLRQQVKARLADNPAQSWDDAVALVIKAHRRCLDDEGAH
jgi:hypothetical protein